MSAEPHVPHRSRLEPSSGGVPADERSRLSVRLSRDTSGRWTAVLVGEIDMDCPQDVQRRLAATARSPAGLDLDLAEVSFCDCAGLGLLLHLRERHIAVGGTLRLVAVSRQVLRLLELTETTAEHLPRPGASATDLDHGGEPAAAPAGTSGSPAARRPA